MSSSSWASIQFNISHSGEWVVVALTLHSPLGIDVEHQDISKDIEGLGKRVMTESEFLEFAASSYENQANLFYSLWVRKEAVLKCMGTGLSLDPRSIEVGHHKTNPDVLVKNRKNIHIIELQTELPLDHYKSAVAYVNSGTDKTVEIQYCTLLDSR